MRSSSVILSVLSSIALVSAHGPDAGMAGPSAFVATFPATAGVQGSVKVSPAKEGGVNFDIKFTGLPATGAPFSMFSYASNGSSLKVVEDTDSPNSVPHPREGRSI
jgi:hypothetical protein